jgi:hypothetical protein
MSRSAFCLNVFSAPVTAAVNAEERLGGLVRCEALGWGRFG